MRKPFMKFLMHASSYLFFLWILILVSQRAEDQIIALFGNETENERFEKQRGKPPMILEYVVLVYVMGYIYEETHEIYVQGMRSYLRNMWNFIDFTRNFLYCLVFLLRVVAYIQQTNEIKQDPSRAYIPREEWHAFDPQLIAEGLFAGANIFSALKLVHLFSINPHLGPLQISLGRMVIDIVKFFFIYSLVLFAFACGLNQLLWYFSELERRKCYHLPNGAADWETQSDACMKWRGFANVFESSQSLFWASFGMVDLSNFELTGIKTYTRFWGLLMFGSYSVINVIVLLNLLIAMMSNSYAMIDEHSDTEWKFARTKLWMSYFEESQTLPPPFNVFPNPKMLCKLFGLRKKDKLRRMSTKRRNKEEKERDHQYTAVMRALVWRYVSAMHKKYDEATVTEDDINEVKGDISAFRYEMLEIFGKNGMDISCAEKREKAVLGKKMKVWERRLMKDFKVAPVATEEEYEQLIYEPPPENEDSLAKFRRIAKLAVLNSNLRKWGQVVRGACLASQIGHCNSRDSFKKQQNLQKAMDEARKMTSRSPLPHSRSSTPIELPDTTGKSIMELLKEIKTQTNDDLLTEKLATKSTRKYPLNPHVLINNKLDQPEISVSPATPVLLRSPDFSSDSYSENGDDIENLLMNDDVQTFAPDTNSLNGLRATEKIEQSPRRFSDGKIIDLPNMSPTSSVSKSLDDITRLPDKLQNQLQIQTTSLTQPTSKMPPPACSVKDLITLYSCPTSPEKTNEPFQQSPLDPVSKKSSSENLTAKDGTKKSSSESITAKEDKILITPKAPPTEPEMKRIPSPPAEQNVTDRLSKSPSPTELKPPIKDLPRKDSLALDAKTITDDKKDTQIEGKNDKQLVVKPLASSESKSKTESIPSCSSVDEKQKIFASTQPEPLTTKSTENVKNEQAGKPKETPTVISPTGTTKRPAPPVPDQVKPATSTPSTSIPVVQLTKEEIKEPIQSPVQSEPSSNRATTPTLQPPTIEEPTKSPLTLRNIRRIEDKPKRRQPKYGWL